MTDPRAQELAHVAAALDAQYVVERELGRGGMGVVYLARDRMLDRLVAIKTLPAHLAGDERVRERFIREARTAANLSHPNIVPIHRADVLDDVVFFVMGFVDGESLADQVRDRGPLPPDEVVRCLREVADALDAAHRRGVVHRDVKAENILITRATGQAMVTDFGIARVTEAAPMTATGMVLGSVFYMSPEQAMGETVDARSDVYSLGVVAFHALTGRFPFENESASAVVIAHVTRPAPPVRSLAPSLPASLAAIVDRCLAKEPSARFESCRALRDALGAVGRDAAVVPVSGRTEVAEERLSDSEAAAVFERAARLADGTRSDAAPLPAVRGTPSPTSSYDVGTVRDAAREAGIATAHIDRALAERARPPHDVADRSRPRSIWTGASNALEYEAIVDGEMSEREFDRLVESIRRALGDVGLVTAVGRSLAWSSTDQNRKVNVSVHIRDGQTTIRASERLAPLAGQLFGGIMGGVGGGIGGSTVGSIMAASRGGEPMLAIAAALGIVVATYGTARFAFRRTSRKRGQTLQALVAQLAEDTRAAIARRASTRRLPHSSDERERVR